MAEVFNSIEIGFEWAQDIGLAAGLLEASDILRADFRYAPEDEEPIFSIASGDGISVDGDTIRLVASGEKTGLVEAPLPKIGWRAIYMEIVRTPLDGVEDNLGFRLKIPAVLPVARASE